MKNVKELWGMYDTVLVGPGMSAYGRGWFESFLQMSKANVIPFFNVRNRSMVGSQYNNQDSAENLAFKYELYSIGVEFLAFAIGDSCVRTIPTPPLEAPAPAAPERAPSLTTEIQIQNSAERQLFAALVDHSSMQFKLSQDIKLVNVCSHQPSGFGTSGSTRMYGAGLNAFGVLSNFTNGEPEIDNRYKFSKPIEMPLNVNFNIEIEMERLAKVYLSAMGGPETWFTSVIVAGEGGNLTPQNSVAAIRVSLIGARYVQQRAELHV